MNYLIWRTIRLVSFRNIKLFMVNALGNRNPVDHHWWYRCLYHNTIRLSEVVFINISRNLQDINPMRQLNIVPFRIISHKRNGCFVRQPFIQPLHLISE